MRQFIFSILITLYCSPLHAQQDSSKQQYLAELKVIGRKFTNELYPNYVAIYSLPEKPFIAKIDSARNNFLTVLNRYQPKLDKGYTLQQQAEIKYYFDKLLIEYPLNHDIYKGKTSTGPSIIVQRLKSNLPDLNKPEQLSNEDFTNYVRAFFSYQVRAELKKPGYKNTDNQHLNAVWALIPAFISNPVCRTFWQYDYLYNHIDNNGIKNIEPVLRKFRSTCKDTAHLNKINTLYAEDSVGRKDHLIRTYKKVGAFNLDIHLFLPDSMMTGNKSPVIVFFHGGSWSEGKPDWFFYACSSYAKKGWVACAVEYRTYGRHETLPFAAVMDARSSIRWLRQHAREYNIDTNKIVASGNSAGGHLALCTALADKWNEATDDLRFSPVPNAVMANAGVYDLTDEGTAWIRKDLKDKRLVEQISPVYLIKQHTPPMLLIHGENDRNVPYASAKKFADEMMKAGNNNIEFYPLKGAGHFIWIDQKYTPQVSSIRTGFLEKLGY